MKVSLRIIVGVMATTLLAPTGSWAAGGSIKGTVSAKKDKYLKNTVVFLDLVAGQHKPPSKSVKIDQKNQKFDPFVLPVIKGTTVEFLNNDNTGHNVFSPDGEKYDLGTWEKGASRKYTYSKAGVYTQLCKLHPSMIAYVVVLQNPYFAVTDDSGNFEIKNIPSGKYSLKVWNERRKADPIDVTVKNGSTAPAVIKLRR